MRNPKTNLIEIIETATGKVLAIQTDHQNLAEAKAPHLIEMTIDGQKVLIEKGIDLEKHRTYSLAYPFVQHVADIICEDIRNGEFITNICKKPGYPSYSIFSKWRAQNEEFDLQYRGAVKDRAELRSEQAIQTAEEATTRDGDPDYKLQVDTYKWAAEKDNPERFGKQIKHTGDENAPLVWHINTGIVRDEDLKEVVDADAQELPDSQTELVGEVGHKNEPEE